MLTEYKTSPEKVKSPLQFERPGLRHAEFLGIAALILTLAHGTVMGWFRLSLQSERYTHLLLIPLMSGVLIYWERNEIFTRIERAVDGVIGMAIGVAIWLSAVWLSAVLPRIDDIGLGVLGILAFCWGLFRFCYGRHAWRTARFPLLFLVFMVPIPAAVLDKAIYWLQAGSSAVVDAMFTLLQVSYLRDGMRFALPTVTIEVGRQCSGIRSSIAMLLLTVLMANSALRSGWRKGLLIASVIPLVLFKNGLRIVTLSLLAVHVDPGFLTGSLHRKGGFVFFGLTFLVVLAFCWLLQRSERRIRKCPTNPAVDTATVVPLR